MRFRLCDLNRLDEFRKVIDEIGLSVSDPNLFSRIHEACQKEQAFLFCAPDCFIVLRPMEFGVLAWVGASFTSTNRKLVMADIDQLCRDISSKTLFFYSNRKGFARIAPGFGFSQFNDVWMGKPITRWVKTYE